MLIQTFKNILLMSASGSLLAIFWLCLAPVTRKIFSPSWQYYIWLTVLLVMILPVHFPVPSRTPDVPTVSVNPAENIETEISQTNSHTADMQISEQAEKMSIPKTELPQNIFYYLANIWFFGVIAVLLTKTAKYNLFLRAIHRNSEIVTDISDIPKRLTVRKTDMLDAPLIVGFFKPCLLLPNTEIDENDMNYILMHELTHYRRGDILYKWFAMTVSSVHWFNPVVYITSRQIDTECEISCDHAVTRKLSDSEKNNYMNMILDLLSSSKGNSKPLTTQMASDKKTLKRRFTMIRSKKSTNKIMSIISAFTAVLMLSTAVFASGILADITAADYTIEILNNGEEIDLANNPFIENGEIYVPLRETIEKAMPKEQGVVDIHWDNGTIDVTVAYYQGISGKYQVKIGGEFVKLQHISYEDYKNNSVEQSMVITSLSLKAAPILKNSTTYVTLKDLNYMLYGYTDRRDESNRLYELTFSIYNKDGEILALKSLPTLNQNYTVGTPEHTVDAFFGLFDGSHYEDMKKYCTQSCIDTYFNGDNIFGIKKASVTEINVDPLEHTKSSNSFNVFVTVDIVPSEDSVFDKNTMSTSFYVVFQRQENGIYLIDRFQTGL